MAKRFRVRGKRIKKSKKLATKLYVKKLLRKEEETKYFDKSSSFTCGAAGVMTDLCQIPQSAGASSDITRIGDKVTIRSLEVGLQGVFADNQQIIRFIIIQWFPNDAFAVPAAASIITSTGSILSPLAPLYHDYQNQYTVVYDKLLVLNNVSMPSKSWRKKINLKYAKKIINFATGTTNGSNKFYLLTISDSTAVTDPTIGIYTRLNFDDA